MTDEYWKKRAEKLPHFKPAHETQGKSLEDALNNIPGLPPPASAPPTKKIDDGGWGREIDLTSKLSGMIPKTPDEIKAFHMSRNPVPPGPNPVNSQQDKVVYLKEGAPCFKAIQTGGQPTPFSLAAPMGPTSGVVGKEFRLIGPKKFYIVENQMQRIDLSKIDPTKMKKLVVVEAPFVGTLLVPESAVINSGQDTRSILKG